jgi:hypothetical protein
MATYEEFKVRHYSNTGLHIGASWNAQTDFFSGMVDDIRLYNSALNAEDFETLVQ